LEPLPDPIPLEVERASTSETVMNKERIQGAAQKAAGSVKQAVGKATHNDRLRVEGAADKVVGTANETIGKTKDAVRKAVRYRSAGLLRRRVDATVRPLRRFAVKRSWKGEP
jgi:uncharacterized protein YjbJ (UPF0337 family)